MSRPGRNSALNLKPPPNNLEAERGVLSALLQGAEAGPVFEQLATEDFFSSLHRRAYARMRLMACHGEALTLVRLCEGMKLDAVEHAELSGLLDPLLRIRKPSELLSYIRSVKRDARHRELLAACEQTITANGDAHIFASELQTRATKFLETVHSLGAPASWRQTFRMVEDLPDGDIEFLIDGVLPAGVTFIGGLSGLGKTWLALSMARALTLRKKFLACWDVPEAVTVLYLVPEMNARAFKRRCVRLGLGGERFLCRTISDGAPLDLSDPVLLAAIRELKPVVFLDTAIRFSNSQDENSAAENQGLARAIFALIHAGARAVVCLHHRAKESARIDELTLENTLRGSGDLGAICDAVWGLQLDRGDGTSAYLKESRRLVRLALRCVKARDFCPPEDFRVQLAPFIDEIGDFGVLTDDAPTASQSAEELTRLDEAIKCDPKAGLRTLERVTGVGRNRIKKLAAQLSWQFADELGWRKS